MPSSLSLKALIFLHYGFVSIQAQTPSPPAEFPGLATFILRLISYENADSRRNDGHFCDPDVLGKLDSDCDPIFMAYIIREGAERTQLYSQSQLYLDTKVVNFGPKLGNSDNPTKQHVNLRQNSHIYLEITVYDHDSTRKDELIDLFVHQLDIKVRSSFQINLVSAITSHSLMFEYHFTCAKDYYGERCTVHCESKDNDIDGHYLCSPEGEKKCMSGWKNVDEDCLVPDWCRWC